MILSIQKQLLVYISVLVSLAYTCLFRPSLLLSQGTLMLLGDAMELPHYPSSSSSLGPAGVLLLFLALFYGVIYGRNDVLFLRAIAPLRVGLSMAVVVTSYLSTRKEIGNSLIFGMAFGELIWAFWMYASLREPGQ